VPGWVPVSERPVLAARSSAGPVEVVEAIEVGWAVRGLVGGTSVGRDVSEDGSESTVAHGSHVGWRRGRAGEEVSAPA
jgi:hypothetical protein